MLLFSIRSEFCVGSSLYRGPVDCLQKLYAAHGTRGIFRGLNVTVLREVPSLSIYMVTYECLRHYMRVGTRDNLSIPAELLAGGLAGVLSWSINIPVDVVKTRLQSDNPSSPKYSGILDCARKSCREEGFRVLFRGLTATCVRAFPTNAVTLVVYSKCLRLLQDQGRDA